MTAFRSSSREKVRLKPDTTYGKAKVRTLTYGIEQKWFETRKKPVRIKDLTRLAYIFEPVADPQVPENKKLRSGAERTHEAFHHLAIDRFGARPG